MAFIGLLLPRHPSRPASVPQAVSTSTLRRSRASSPLVARRDCRPGEMTMRKRNDDADDTNFRPHVPHVPVSDDCGDGTNTDGFLPVELVEGYLDNAKVRPKIDLDADEYMLMWKLRKMLHEDDFKKIFDSRSRWIGEF